MIYKIVDFEQRENGTVAIFRGSGLLDLPIAIKITNGSNWAVFKFNTLDFLRDALYLVNDYTIINLNTGESVFPQTRRSLLNSVTTLIHENGQKNKIADIYKELGKVTSYNGNTD